MIIFIIALITAFITSNPMFALFGFLWLMFNLMDKKTEQVLNPTNNFVTGKKEL